MKRLLICLCVLFCTAAFGAEDWQAEAKQRIEEHRKENVTLTVTQNGKPLTGAAVKVEFQGHEFLFGCNIFKWNRCATPEENEAYQERFAEVFNFATLGFYWWTFEPEQGKRKHADVDRVLAWCEDNGIRAKGHPLAWNFSDPAWAKNIAEDDLYRWQLEYARQCPERYRDKIETWDVINEVVQWDRSECLRQAPKLTALMKERGSIEYAKACFHEARKGNPGATLLINDYMTGPEYASLVEKLTDENGKPLYDAIGLQSHMHSGTWNNGHIWDVCERFAKFKAPVHFTELTLLSGEGKFDWNNRKGMETTSEGERKQAEEVVRIYTMLFSHPSVEAITWWDLSDQGAWMNAPAGLLRKDMTPKPAFEALKKLVTEDWTTNETLQTDEKGEVKLRAFRGDYRITVTLPDGKRQTLPVNVDKGGNELILEIGL